MKKHLSLILCSVLSVVGSLHVAAQVHLVKLEHFGMQSSSIVGTTGASLSMPGYHSKDHWFPVRVPCTVLSGLVANKVYPDPYVGLNNMLIPDASDTFNREYHLDKYSHMPGEPNPWKKPYWYRTGFSVPAAEKGRHFELVFKGINYRAEVWLNGQKIADSSQMAGMFAEHYLEVSAVIRAGSENALAVKIYPLDEPGLPATPQLEAMDEFYENGGPTGDIGKNVTMLSSVGWDWIPEVRDRNMGIWQPVFLRSSGQVVISHPRVVTSLSALPDTSVAELGIDLVLTDHGAVGGGADHRATNGGVISAGSGELQVTISPENFVGLSIVCSKRLDVTGRQEVHLTSKELPQLRLHNPKLWWPNGYGDPNLYRVRLRYVRGGVVSDDTSFLVGVRTVASKAVDVSGWVRRDFYVNGRRVHLVGGAWVPDMMLNRDSVRYDRELRLCRNANVNMVRIWGGGLGETDDFYELADRYGLLVWQDFWITGDTNGGFKGSADWPTEGKVFIDNVVNTILRIRNHASLLVWTGGNEGHAREELYNAMRDNVANLDGTRPFIPCSSGFSKAPASWKGSWPDDRPSGVYSGGPYSWQDDAQYYHLVNLGRDWVFKDETGLPSQPPYNTLTKIIPNLVHDPALPYPLNNSWGYHDACTGNGKYDTYYKAMIDRFGEPGDLKDFSIKMQLLNAGGYRGIFEAAGHKLNETGGVMLWKLNAAFPSVAWQVFDWYLEPNAGYYYMQRACEPVHIQLNLDDSSVALVNRTYVSRPGLHYEAQVLSFEGKLLYEVKGATALGETDVKVVASLRERLAMVSGVSFVILRLKDAAGKLVSHNEYWMSPKHDFTSLRQMSAAQVDVKIVGTSSGKHYTSWTYRFSNVSKQLAFFLNPQLVRNGEEILPSFWRDNYFSLAPGEVRDIKVEVAAEDLIAGRPELRLEGWNVPEKVVHLDTR